MDGWMDGYLDVFEEWKTFTPFDNFIQSVISDAAETGHGIAVSIGGSIGGSISGSIGATSAAAAAAAAASVAMLLSLSLVTVPQMLHVHNLHEQLRHRRRRRRRRRRAPFGRIHGPRVGVAVRHLGSVDSGRN